MKKFQRESGIVSIFVATMLIIIVSLIVLAFAQVSRREARESLDTQLSSQAYYAAETGVNDAKAAITSYLNANPGASISSRDQCNDTAQPYDKLATTKTLSATNDVSYTCVLVNTSPKFLRTDVSNDAQVIPLKTSDGSKFFRTITISWNAADGSAAPNISTCPNTLNSFPQASKWTCPYGGLRLDLVPFSGSQSENSLLDSNMAAFLMPWRTNTPAGNGNVDYQANGKVVAGSNCTSGTCSVTITIPNMAIASNVYYLRLSKLYRPSTVTITAKDQSNKDVQFKDSMAMIDATGKAQDVLRRIVVSVSLVSSGTKVPSSALNSGDSICKRFRVSNGFFSTDMSDAGTNNNSVNNQPGADNPLCTSVSYSVPPPVCSQPHDVALVLDESNSMQENWTRGASRQDELKQVAQDYIASTASTTGNYVSVVRFSSKKDTASVLNLGDSAGTVKTAIQSMKLSQGTYYSGGLQIAEDQLTNKSGNNRARPGVPKIVIFVSDGKPDSPAETESSILAAADKLKQAGITIYTVGIDKGDGDANLLDRMATGGTASPSTTTRYYTTAATETDFEAFFSGIKTDINC